jgi:hypothetical protein
MTFASISIELRTMFSLQDKQLNCGIRSAASFAGTISTAPRPHLQVIAACSMRVWYHFSDGKTQTLTTFPPMTFIAWGQSSPANGVESLPSPDGPIPGGGGVSGSPFVDSSADIGSRFSKIRLL